MVRGTKDWARSEPTKTLFELIREGRCFVGQATKNGVAGKFIKHQLWNPQNSGVYLYLDHSSLCIPGKRHHP